MFERRPIWCVVLGLNLCVLIWRMSVQEPPLIESGRYAISTSSGNISNYYKLQRQEYSDAEIDSSTVGSEQQQQQHYEQQQQPYSGKHLLSERFQPINETIIVTDNFGVNQNRYDYKDAGAAAAASMIDDKSALLVTSATLQTVADQIQTSPITPMVVSTSAFYLAQSDISKLIDLCDFRYLISQSKCSKHIEALILVHSAPDNIEKRTIIRNTWGSILRSTPLRLIFLLGAVDNNVSQKLLEHENAKFGDMIQGSFIDNYRNMTYKHVMAFKWFLYNCAHAQILMKVDDDVYVNTPQLLEYLNKRKNTTVVDSDADNMISTNTTTTVDENKIEFNAAKELFHHPRNLLFCQQQKSINVKRSYRSKWRVSTKEYAGRYYPPYCPGYAIIYSRDVVYNLYNAAQKSKYFWIDDVQITGVLAQLINITITSSLNYLLLGKECKRLLSGQDNPNKPEFLYASHGITPLERLSLWRLQSKTVNNTIPLKSSTSSTFSLSSLTSSLTTKKAKPLAATKSHIYGKYLEALEARR